MSTSWQTQLEEEHADARASVERDADRTTHAYQEEIMQLQQQLQKARTDAGDLRRGPAQHTGADRQQVGHGGAPSSQPGRSKTWQLPEAKRPTDPATTSATKHVHAEVRGVA